jgi:CO/xanthine dehydrogenase Mo-binding subunit
MNKPISPANSIEPERYELFASPSYHFDLERRDFFKALGAGLLIVCVIKDASALQESGGRRHNDEDSLPQAISAWLHIDENGGVTVFTGKVEVGQNIRTSLSQAVAEELHFPLEKIQIVMGDTQLVPYDMGTFGSRTTPTMNLQLRHAAAAARDALVGLAAEQWKVNAARLIAADGKITDPRTKQSVEYAALVCDRQLQQVIPEGDPLAPASKWTVQGQPVPKMDGRDFVTGKHRYPSDQKIAGDVVRKNSAAIFLRRDSGVRRTAGRGVHEQCDLCARRKLCRCRCSDGKTGVAGNCFRAGRMEDGTAAFEQRIV